MVWQVRSIGKRDYGHLFKLGDELIQFAPLHSLLAGSVADMVPVNVGILLSDDAKRQARSAPVPGPLEKGLQEQRSPVKSFEGLMTSSWKVWPPQPPPSPGTTSNADAARWVYECSGCGWHKQAAAWLLPSVCARHPVCSTTHTTPLHCHPKPGHCFQR